MLRPVRQEGSSHLADVNLETGDTLVDEPDRYVTLAVHDLAVSLDLISLRLLLLHLAQEPVEAAVVHRLVRLEVHRQLHVSGHRARSSHLQSSYRPGRSQMGFTRSLVSQAYSCAGWSQAGQRGPLW